MATQVIPGAAALVEVVFEVVFEARAMDAVPPVLADGGGRE